MASAFKDPAADAVPLDAAELFSMRGKVCLVTGGSRGIGLMIASGFAANGAAKVLICSRKAKACEEAAAAINAKYRTNCAISCPGDLSTYQGVQGVVAALDALGVDKLHVLINNAGATWGAPYHDYPDEAWAKVFDLNVRHVFNLTRLLTPKLAAAAVQGDPARVVNIASVDGVRASQTEGPTAAFAYTVSKAAVIHLTNSLCRALSKYNVTVNTISPGVFPSNMTSFMLTSDSIKGMVEGSNPLGRVGETKDMAGTALYLVSRPGSFTNGANIVVDGGAHLHGADISSSRQQAKL